MPNETEDYNNFVRANLPAGMTYSANRYRYNNHSFYVFELAAWYYYYLLRVNSPSNLFSNSEQGVWYDPSDLTTLFQDSAGTTPVTAAGQPVGLMLDKSKGLVLGAEIIINGDFSQGSTNWTVGTGWSISGGVATHTGANGILVSQPPTATTTGMFYLIEFDYSGNTGAFQTYLRGTSVSPSSVTSSGHFKAIGVAGSSTGEGLTILATANLTIDNVSVKLLAGNHATQATSAQRPTYGFHPYSGVRNLLLATDTMATQSRTVTAVPHTLSFTGTGTITLTGASIAGPLVGTGAGNRVSLTFTPTAASLTMTVVGSVTFAQLEVGATATNYQKVVTQYEVTEAGVPSVHYLAFDGVDDGMVTNSITPATDKAQIFAGFKKSALTGGALLAELSATADTSNGSVGFFSDAVAGSGIYQARTRGTALVSTNYTTSSINPTIVTFSADLAAPRQIMRVNGSQVVSSASNTGGGNFLAYPIYIGRRAGTSFPFNGNLYSLIVRFGGNLATNQITNTETWVNQKTGAY